MFFARRCDVRRAPRAVPRLAGALERARRCHRDPHRRSQGTGGCGRDGASTAKTTGCRRPTCSLTADRGARALACRRSCTRSRRGEGPSACTAAPSGPACCRSCIRNHPAALFRIVLGGAHLRAFLNGVNAAIRIVRCGSDRDPSAFFAAASSALRVPRLRGAAEAEQWFLQVVDILPRVPADNCVYATHAVSLARSVAPRGKREIGGNAPPRCSDSHTAPSTAPTSAARPRR